ncbi:hypothetical protein HY29_15105 [Hyphomonas beringensis]|uniref:DUF4164 domain-containing protein n=1 Tax=Hyphomonas beringensis TaxID=1280946 RepID=A0A062U7L1_9PROT|nr:DUF4164 family protein [Hyphomonas beringensis]KCZ54257.1 hypothetical protein HY29_15105 [Hyphomonas beringensis]
MSEIDPAIRQLENALTRLEGALDSLMARAGDPDVVKAELAALVSDRAQLADELDASLARERELQILADEASAALGSAIEEVRAAIGRGEGQSGG